jgi:guanine nucleotide-binding protein subunit alpha
MSDPITNDKRAFALMNAVDTNMDRLRQSINALRQLHDRWNDGNGTFINLIAQLTALKSNLSEMRDWMDHAINEMHVQLLMDLNVLMTSCGTLVRNLDGLMAQLRQPDHDDWAIKLKFAVASKSMVRLRSVAKRQTDAVTLLLAACKWYAS